ncbi:hypothetical protein SSS_03899 [Sarcoptes scabiei]|uniref:Uncharacterized protein n=1 Tax=Sarcoptes scabiei TaxID=52283 RepID=A0A834R5V3_SARSC|nr:hypothetical protein SSS_03899 [Sarcoptes scabiei]
MSSSVLTPVPNHSLFIKRIPFETRLRDAEYAVLHSDRIRLFGQWRLHVEFAQGKRKTPSEMRYCDSFRLSSPSASSLHSNNYRSHRNRSRSSSSRSRSRLRRVRSASRSSRSSSRSFRDYRKSSRDHHHHHHHHH